MERLADRLGCHAAFSRADACNQSRHRVVNEGLRWSAESSQAHRIFCPVFFQSARNSSKPLSVSGCLTSVLRMAGGMVAISAPRIAACLTWFTLRIEAAR